MLKLIANGKDNAEIAQELHISPKTVKNHISNILMKLQIGTASRQLSTPSEAGWFKDFRFGRFAAKRGQEPLRAARSRFARARRRAAWASFACCLLLPWSSSAASVAIDRPGAHTPRRASAPRRSRP